MIKKEKNKGSKLYLYLSLIVFAITAFVYQNDKKEVRKQPSRIPAANLEKNRQVKKTNAAVTETSEIKMKPPETSPIKAEKVTLVDFENEEIRRGCFANLRRQQDPAVARQRMEVVFQNLGYPEWFFPYEGWRTPLKESQKPNIQFQKALLLSDIRSEVLIDYIDLEKGYDLLLNLHRSEPKNSAYVLALMAFYKINKRFSELQQMAAKIAQTEYFESYHSTTIKDFYAYVASEPELFDNTLYVQRSGTPYAHFSGLSKDFDLTKIGLQIQNKYDPTSKSYDPFSMDVEEFSFASHVLKDVKENKERNDKLSELLIEKRKNGIFAQSLFENALATNCDYRSLTPFLEKVKSYYKINTNR